MFPRFFGQSPQQLVFASLWMTHWKLTQGEGGEGLKHIISWYVFNIRLVDIDTSIPQTFYLDGDHGFFIVYPAEFSFQILQRSTDDAHSVTGLEDMLFHLPVCRNGGA